MCQQCQRSTLRGRPISPGSAPTARRGCGRIGDGRATNALIGALQHPNSNVRWSAVRALTQAGDMRAMLELHRVAQNDQGRTSWGESVAGAAQSALDQVRSKSVWGQSLELIKTAVVSVMMLLALIFAFSSVQTLRRELDSFGQSAPNQVLEPLLLPTLTPAPTREPQPTLEPLAVETAVITGTALASGPTVAPLATDDGLAGTILQAANIRPAPSTDNEPIGQVQAGEPIIFLGRTADNQWYRIRLAPEADAQSRINNPDGSNSGWVNRALVSEPDGDVPVEEAQGSSVPPSRHLGPAAPRAIAARCARCRLQVPLLFVLGSLLSAGSLSACGSCSCSPKFPYTTRSTSAHAMPRMCRALARHSGGRRQEARAPHAGRTSAARCCSH
ncbi:SH3 domain-containing protein [Candidatus Gracilibacteria bacterium]|nr:SH3 domain-containing protein [Candidatus Gracilibacteria bacterium]